MTDKEKIRAEIERRIEELQPCNTRENLRAHGAIAGYYQILSFINSMQEEPVSEDLGDYINELSKQFPEVSFAKLSRIAVRVAKWQQERDEADRAAVYKCGWNDRKVQMMKNLWKPADGNDLPIIDREVIALLDNGKVVFAHRPNPEGWDAKSIITEKVEHYTPKTYDKCGWNIPNIKYWLDVELSKEIEL